MKDKFSNRLIEALAIRHMSQSELSQKTGLNKSSISQYVHGKNIPMQNALYLISKVLNINAEWLMGYDVPMERNIRVSDPNNLGRDILPQKRIPVIGTVAAGLPLLADECIEGYVYTDLNGGNEYFGLIVNGDSMDNMGIFDKDIIIIKKTPDVENGSVAVVLVDDDEATVKKYYRNENVVTLIPDSTNQEHDPQLYDLSKTDVKIIGQYIKKA